MARGLYERDPAFAAEVDECAEVLRAELGFDLRDVLYPAPAQEAAAAEQQLAQTAVTQPALFVDRVRAGARVAAARASSPTA